MRTCDWVGAGGSRAITRRAKRATRQLRETPSKGRTARGADADVNVGHGPAAAPAVCAVEKI